MGPSLSSECTVIGPQAHDMTPFSPEPPSADRPQTSSVQEVRHRWDHRTGLVDGFVGSVGEGLGPDLQAVFCAARGRSSVTSASLPDFTS